MKRPPLVIKDEVMRHRVLDLIARLDLSKPWEVTVNPHRKKRTLAQNALMWSWVNEVADHVRDYTGMDSDEIHEFFKAKFLPARLIEVNGDSVEYRTTTKLTRQEMSEYMDRIYHWATSELGLLLPSPADLGRDAA